MAFDTGVGFAFTGRDAGLGKAAGMASSSIAGIGSAIDTVGTRLEANAEHVQAFLKEFSQSQMDRIKDGLTSIADSASINQTSLEGMGAAASKAAKPIVASLGLTGAAAKTAKKQIVGLSIGMNVGAESVGNAVKAMQLYGKELKAVGIDSVKTATKFQEVSGIQVDKLGAQVAGLARSWGLTEDQLSDLIPWILESGRAFGFGRESIEGMATVTQALDQNLSKVLLKDGPQAIMKFTKGIQGLALVSAEALGMEFPDALGQSIDLFNKLAGDMGTFQKTFSGLSSDFGPLAESLGLAIGDWDTAFQLVKNDPLEFAKQLRVLMDNMEMSDETSQAFLSRLKLQLGEDSSMLRFLTEQGEGMDKALSKLDGVEAGTDALKNYADQGFSTGRTMAESLDLMRESAKMSFMSISKDMWRPYMKNLKNSYRSTTKMMKGLASDTEPGGIGYLVKAAAMGMRFGPGGAIAALFPGKSGSEARGMIDALSDSLVDMLPHLTALGALGFRPTMIAAPFQYALKPLALLGGPLGSFNTMMMGIPKLALSIFGPLGVLALAIGGFTLLSKKWQDEEESKIETFFKKDAPIAILRGISKMFTGKDLTKKYRKELGKMSSPELWGMVAEDSMEALGKGFEVGMEALDIGSDVLVRFTDKFADALTRSMAKIDWDKFGTALAKILTNLTKAAGAIVAKTPQIVWGLAKGIVIGLSKIDWGGLFGGVKKDLGKEAEGVGETMQAGFGWENVLGAGALIGVPLMLRKFKKIKKEGGSILGSLRKDVKKGVPPEAAGLPSCIPTCAGGAAGKTTAAAGKQAAVSKKIHGVRPVPLHPSQMPWMKGKETEKAVEKAMKAPGPKMTAAISGPAAVMQPIKAQREASKTAKAMNQAATKLKGAAGKMAKSKGMMGMGAAGGLLSGAALGGAALGGADIGGMEMAMGVGSAAMMGGPWAAAIAGGMAAAGAGVGEFNKIFKKSMGRAEEDAKIAADAIGKAFGVIPAVTGQSIEEMVSDVSEGLSDNNARVLEHAEKMGLLSSSKLEKGLAATIAGYFKFTDTITLGTYSKIGKWVTKLMTGMEVDAKQMPEIIAVALEKWVKQTQQRSAQLGAYMGQVMVNVVKLSKGLFDTAGSLIQNIGKLIESWIELKMPKVYKVFKFLVGQVEVLWGAAKMFFGKLSASVEQTYIKFKTAVQRTIATAKYFWEVGKLLASKAKLFLTQMYYSLQDMIEGAVVGALTSFQGVMSSFWDTFKALPKSVLDQMKKIEGVGDFLTFIETTADTVGDAIEDRLDQMAEAAKQRTRDLLGLQQDVTLQQIAADKASAESTKKTEADKEKAVKDNTDAVLADLDKLKSGLSDVGTEFGKLGEVGWIFKPPEEKEKWLKDQGLEDVASLAAIEGAVMEGYKTRLEGYGIITEEMAAKTAEAAGKRAEDALAAFGKKETGLKGKALSNLKGVASEALGEMAQAATPEQAAAIIHAAVADTKGKKKKAALQKMLAASGAAMFAEGPLVGAVGKTTGDLAKEGLAFTEMMLQQQADVLEKGGKKKKKALAETEKAIEAVQELQKAEVGAPEAAQAVDIGGGIQMLPPPPPAAAKAGGGGPGGGGWVQASAAPVINVTVDAKNVSGTLTLNDPTSNAKAFGTLEKTA